MLNTTEILNHYKSGKTIIEIAQFYHVATYSIQQIIQPLGLPNTK